MIKKRESIIQKEILNYLKSKEIFSFKTILCNMRGIPDIIAIHNSKFIAIECKTTKGKLSKLQEIVRDKIIASNGVYILARNLYDVKFYFEGDL